MSALANSVKLGVVVSVGGMILAVLISWTVLKLRPRGARFWISYPLSPMGYLESLPDSA